MRFSPCDSRRPRDEGAAAVELALLLPLLLTILLGILGFGRAFHTQLELSNAAQEGARYMVFSPSASVGTAQGVVVAAASLVPPLTSGDVVVTGSCATAGSNITVTASRVVTFTYVLGDFNRTITGRAVMRCAG